MKVAIVGSRLRKDAQPEVEALVQRLPAQTTVVSGHCAGIDQWAENAAAARGLRVISCAPGVTRTMRPFERVQEYYRRNDEIVAHADELYAFVAPDWTTAADRGGTNYTIRSAMKKGIPVHIMRAES